MICSPKKKLKLSLEERTLEDKMKLIRVRRTINVEDYLDSFAQDTLGEIGNISFGSSATALSTLLGQKVEITTP